MNLLRMGASSSKNIQIPTNTKNYLLQPRKKSKITNAIRSNVVQSGNNTVVGEVPNNVSPQRLSRVSITSNFEPRSRSSSTASRNSIVSTISRSGSSEISQYTPPNNRRNISIQPINQIQSKSALPLRRLPGRKISIGGSKKQRGRKNKTRRRKN